MKVVSDGILAIYVYSSEAMQRHHSPHCHIRSTGGEIVVALPTLVIIVGGKLSKRAKSLLTENLDKICDAWNQLNPEITTKHDKK